MADEGSIRIAGTQYSIAYDVTLPSGKRAFQRALRPSQASDASRIGQMTWQLGGTPIGRSREGEDGILATDYADNIETLYDDLLTASPSPNNVTLTTRDPSSSASAKWAGFKWGGAKFAGGGATSTAGNAEFSASSAGYLFIGRGPFLTQISSAWAVVKTTVMGSIIEGMATWQNYIWVGLGAGAALQKITGIGSTGSTNSDVSVSSSTIYSGYLKRGNDRLWLVDAQNNQMRYTFDPFTTISNAFTVGDDSRQLTGIGTQGPYTIVGAEDGIFGFTDSGKPVNIHDLDGEESLNNGAQSVTMWGWTYMITDLGVIAWTPNVANPVGLESLKNFDGAIDGRPTAIGKHRDDLYVAYLTTAGDTYIVRGRFGPATESTGLPTWYPFKKLSSVECDLITATPRSFSTNPNIVVGRGTNIARYIMGRRGRDIADSNYLFSTEGGTWYGTTATRAQSLHKFLRYAMFFTEDCDATKTWQLAVSCDGYSYVNVGNPVSTNGHQVVRPVTGGKPLPTATFHTIKPKLTQVNDSTTTPPLIRGHLTMVYDERPDMIEEVQAFIYLESDQAWGNLKKLVGHETEVPGGVSLPGDRTAQYGFLTELGPMQDVNKDGVLMAQVSIQMWQTS